VLLVTRLVAINALVEQDIWGMEHSAKVHAYHSPASTVKQEWKW
jgi:hypothetical protein